MTTCIRSGPDRASTAINHRSARLTSLLPGSYSVSPPAFPKAHDYTTARSGRREHLPAPRMGGRAAAG